ncbi:MAG: PAC2 family protein [Candidatus Hodarchaeales archaeon]|jgi:predicted ATP-grasp superfamily ATP-dependent carboligase
MYLEKLTEEIEEWLEKADEEETLQFLDRPIPESTEGIIILELLGYYGAVAQTVTKELQALSQKSVKLAGVFSSYFNEMIQFIGEEILLPVSLVQVQIGSNQFILTTSSYAIPDVISYQLAEELWAYYLKLKPSKIIIIDGVHNYRRDIQSVPEVHKVNSSRSGVKFQNENASDFTMMGQAASSFLTYYSNSDNIPIELLTVDSFAEYDPVSALELLKLLTHDFKIEHDYSKLQKEVDTFINGYQVSKESTPDARKINSSESQFFL